MKLKILIYSFLSLLLFGGCGKEELTPAAEIPPLYTLPQGNHPYDKTIVDFYNTYGTYILYKFTDKDFRWNFNTNISFVAEQGDENYIEPALAALDKYLIKLYPTDFLKKALPYKIILSSRIRSVSTNGTVLDNYINAVSTSSHFAFGRAGSTLSTLTEAQLKTMKAELNREFWRQASAYGKIPMPPAFVAATSYNVVTAANRRTYGVFTVPNGSQNIYGDLVDYLYNIALQTPQEWEQTVFTTTNDPTGRFRFKYNSIINYYKEKYGLDLQSVSQNK
ncbi:hypothetical protein [Pedobacter rhizosphaerae]|uniref:Uncharacterized protein n=1 Tax=Pedobacter rhizosphaerae TaxID=390241 RepID=A0A1H9KQU7_9SPHI|nr:hypothetical protein [Pedobacter rhizosphaerae]SER01530.1 hypothetical protein SAMN04488023_103110 [Pedobacter rhizosphaerae]